MFLYFCTNIKFLSFEYLGKGSNIVNDSYMLFKTESVIYKDMLLKIVFKTGKYGDFGKILLDIF